MAAAATQTSTEVTTREPRPLGIRRKPQLRLALGYRDEQRKGAPVKTDYFIPKGNESAVAKFRRVYGEQPRTVDIRLPGTLGGFLEIKHLAFAGGTADTGGILKAVGRTNFALEGTLGGPDILTVFDVVDGKLDVREVEIGGVEDIDALMAAGLARYVKKQDGSQVLQRDLALTTTVAFGIPDVLGFGGVCAITSRGKETTDTLWETAVDIYGNLGPAASMILRPKLILKPSKMLTPGGQRTDVYVLDLYVPESRDEILATAERLHALLPAQGRAAAGMLYGPTTGEIAGELPSAESFLHDLNPDDVIDEDTPGRSPVDVTEGGGTATDSPRAETSGGDDQQAEAEAQGATPPSASAPDSQPLDGEPVDEPEQQSVFQAPAGAVSEDAAALAAAADEAGREVVDVGRNKGKTIADVSTKWLKWAIKEPGFQHGPAARAYARVHEPETYAEAMAELEAGDES